MAIEPQIAFRGMNPSPAAEAEIRRLSTELGRFSDRVVGCRVAVDAVTRRPRQGRIYQVTIELDVAGGRVVTRREPAEDHAHEDLHVAIRDAFDAARRRLQDHMRRMDGRTKQHAVPVSTTAGQ